MNVTYSLQLTAICPVNDSIDAYECVVRSSRTIPCEQILEAAKEVDVLKEYQETICQVLAEKLQAEVTLLGYHSGVKTEVTCMPEKQ